MPDEASLIVVVKTNSNTYFSTMMIIKLNLND